MGVVQLPDELQQMIEREVADGRATTTMAFLEEAVRRLIDETRIEGDQLRESAAAGSADIDAGRYTMIATPEDERHLQQGLMGRLKARLSADE